MSSPRDQPAASAALETWSDGTHDTATPQASTQQVARLPDRQKRVEITLCLAIRHRRVHLRHQLATRAVHDGVRGGDDEVLRPHVGLEREPAALRRAST